ncbi:T9SS type A sorting domain-containing protein [bacterium]|nr:T9SS type A sorting domain-containing protein [bacterium]
MKRTTAFLFTVTLSVVLLVSGAFAANIAIIESQSFNANDIMDINWQAVATGMGHNVTIYPQTALDNGSFITPNDMAIISSGVGTMSFQRRQMIIECLYAGKPVYLQCERDMTGSSNIAWEEALFQFGISWSWLGADPGNLVPMYLSGPISNVTYPISNMPMFMDGGYGSAVSGVETTHHYADKEYGWILRPTADHAMMATNTDQEWVRTFADPNLMENYINTLLPQTTADLQVRAWTTGPVTLPNVGGAFVYNAQVHNWGPVAQVFDAWIRVQLPNGNLFGPTQQFTGLTLAPSTSSAVVTLSQSVPGFAPPGIYYMQAVVGSYSWPIKNIDAFAFTKLVISPDDMEPVNTWQAGGMEAFQQTASLNESPSAIPLEYTLSEPYPNPFNPTAQVSVSLPEAAPLAVTVYNMHGQEVARLAEGISSAGTHEFSFDGSELASGVYIVRAVSPGHLNQSRKLVLMK